MSQGAGPHELLDGATLRSTFHAAAQHLRDSAAAVDAINVYPVPDGDTGSNMSATLREAVGRTDDLGDQATVAQVLERIARGALYGARGNSGVILSQALRGFAEGVGPAEQLDAHGLANGLKRASEEAYRAVSRPQEGTMLTVLREAAQAAEAAANSLPNQGRAAGCLSVMAAAVAGAERAEAETIDQLPSLKEAGVPDAGGEGVCVILRGLFGAISGRMPVAREALAVGGAGGDGEHSDEAFGFCTEFLLEPAGHPLEAATVRALAEANGNRSVVVVGDESLIRVHAHTLEPQALVDAAERLGTVSRLKVEDMTAQNVRYRASGSGAGARVGLLALSRGAGFDEVFMSLGAAVSDLGVIEKPPAGEIAAAADALGIPDVIVLPNHKNVLLAAEQAKGLTRCTLHVIPTASLPQGVAAALAFTPDDTVAELVESMGSAAQAVRTVEVTTAGASRTVDGVAVGEGQAIVLLDGVLVAAAGTPGEALAAGLDRANLQAGALVTIYGGEGLEPGALERARAETESAHPGVEVETVAGQQALYQFIASIE